MSNPMLPLERESHERNRKFQPRREAIGFRFNEPTRTYLEYDASLSFNEFEVRTGRVVDSGVLERVEKVEVKKAEAA